MSVNKQLSLNVYLPNSLKSFNYSSITFINCENELLENTTPPTLLSHPSAIRANGKTFRLEIFLRQ